MGRPTVGQRGGHIGIWGELPQSSCAYTHTPSQSLHAPVFEGTSKRVICRIMGLNMEREVTGLPPVTLRLHPGGSRHKPRAGERDALLLAVTWPGTYVTESARACNCYFNQWPCREGGKVGMGKEGDRGLQLDGHVISRCHLLRGRGA